MQIGSFFKNLIVEDDGKAETKTAPPVATGSVPPPPPVVLPPVAVTSDPAMEEQLLQKVATDAVPAFKALFAHLATLTDVVPDEVQRYKAAIKLTIKGGHTPVELLADFDKCLGTLDTHDKEFQAELAVQITKKVESHRTSAKKAQEAIETTRKQIEGLQAQIVEQEKTVQIELDTATTKEREISEVRSRFSGSILNVRRTLEDQKSKVTNYGKGL